MNIALWVLQVLLGLLFAGSGAVKLAAIQRAAAEESAHGLGG